MSHYEHPVRTENDIRLDGVSALLDGQLVGLAGVLGGIAGCTPVRDYKRKRPHTPRLLIAVGEHPANYRRGTS